MVGKGVTLVCLLLLNLDIAYGRVRYFIQQEAGMNCDQVCEPYHATCAAEGHGFDAKGINAIMAFKMNKIGCRYDKNTDYYTYPTEPAWHIKETTRGGLAERCTGFKNIPKKIDCGKVPSHDDTRRLCPCKPIIEYVLQNEDQSRQSCDQICASKGKTCKATGHGMTNDIILKLFWVNDARCGKSPPEHEEYKYPEEPVYYTGQSTTLAYKCVGWKNIPETIDCGANTAGPEARRLCPCVE